MRGRRRNGGDAPLRLSAKIFQGILRHVPYADPEKQAEYHRNYYREYMRNRYATDEEFREAEKARKREAYQANREKVIARVIAARARRKAAQAAAAAAAVKSPRKAE